ncbi:DUF4945 domain-containing protein [Parabacteroides sp. Marseille-P3160]|uniref:DUF4945 domain-containing protein n=1 Tax=Parabacteroides sp. Marseille-P3160 TaxID=1917887 RepID=UPI0013595B74|nr:DUF4945 domain-containing protein [Parabacteroides sp. Marseille-P3160]
MKRIVYLLTILTMVLMYTSCYDRDILDLKEGVSLPPVTNLTYSLSGQTASLTWGIPGDISSEISKPLSVNIQVLQYKPGILSPIRVYTVTLENEPTTATFTVSTTDENEYHVIVKLVGNVKEAVYGESTLIYSLGQTIVIK